jgi:aldehyde dehydrogenase (NAD+)
VNDQVSASVAPNMVFQNFIGGRERPASDGMTLDVFSPVDGSLFARIASGTAEDIDEAVKAARSAFEGAWGKLTATERGRLLMKLAAVVESHADELAILESRDNGKPLRQSRADAIALARYFEFYGSAADKLHGDVIPYLNTHFIGVERVPHGVTGHIVPWNYPMQIFGRSVGAALAAGNATVVKPPEDASLTILRVTALAREVGFPEGALNVVTGLGRTAGAALAGHPGIDFLSFTGSPETGTAVQTAAARNHVGVTLELGGKSAQVVFDDADLERALPTLVNAIIQNGGQTCSAGSRLLIQRGIFQDVVDAVAERFRALRAGHPEREPDLGPMINQAQQRRVLAYLERGRNEGLTIVAEGVVALDAPPSGYYVAPTLLAPVPHGSILSQEEVFGPVLVATPFEDEAEAIRLANGTAYGLAAGIWSRDAMRSTGLRELLRRRRRNRTALRRLRPVRPRAREGLRGPDRVHHDPDARHRARVIQHGSNQGKNHESP